MFFIKLDVISAQFYGISWWFYSERMLRLAMVFCWSFFSCILDQIDCIRREVFAISTLGMSRYYVCGYRQIYTYYISFQPVDPKELDLSMCSSLNNIGRDLSEFDEL